MDKWVDVAVVASAKDQHGGLVVRTSTAGPSLMLRENLEVAFAPPVIDAPRRGRITALRPLSETSASLHFDTVLTADLARLLVGCHLLVRASDFEAMRQAKNVLSVEGFSVFDEAEGDVGVVVRVVEHPGQLLLELARPDGGSALVPFVDEIIVGIDEAVRRIDIRAPRGLFEL